MNASSQTIRMNKEFSLVAWIKAHDLLTFFFLTFLLTFGGWFLALITGVGGLFDFGLWGPALSAIIATAVMRGKPGLTELFRRLLL